MNKKAAIIAAVGLVGVLAVGALAVSANVRFDQEQDVLAKGAKRELAQNKKSKPIVKRRTIRRHKTVQDGGTGSTGPVVFGGSGGGSSQGSPSRNSGNRSGNAGSTSGSSFEDEDEPEDHEEQEDHEDEEHEDEGGDD